MGSSMGYSYILGPLHKWSYYSKRLHKLLHNTNNGKGKEVTACPHGGGGRKTALTSEPASISCPKSVKHQLSGHLSGWQEKVCRLPIQYCN
ncbi:hypothetical protein BaRGS_00019429 [Batillaria attramentaria]|uniref:Uncharacterized protein n=1 Tax=Batillaria attramentaria TaxID=370345 RepID=A0ABD0KQU5_9CAEN